jgi:penicillin-binding protein 1C
MSDSFYQGDSKNISKRFRRLLDSDEDRESDQNVEESNPDIEHDPLIQEIESGLSDYQTSSDPDETGSISQIEIPAGYEYQNNEITGISISDPVLPLISPKTDRYIPAEEPIEIILPGIDEYGMPVLGKTQKTNHSHVLGVANPNIQAQSHTSNSEKKSSPNKVNQPVQKQSEHHTPPKKKRSHNTSLISIKQGFGCFLRMFLLAALAGVILILIGGSFALYEYYNIAATLPSVEDLQQRASTFETTRIFDRNGNLLYEILDPSAGRRTFITLGNISPYMVAATIATEDKSFYSHPGFDWTAIARAFWQNFRGGETISGASTITQQLARGLLFSPEERTEQSYIRKVREALLAAEITRRYSKDQILELYLNEFYYGNLAYGVEAASETYFDITADQLDLAQASFLAGLPQAPSIYDVYHDRDAVRERQKQVLTLMYEASNEQGCLFVSNSPQRICVDAPAAVEAFTALENYQFNPPDVLIKYPHWVNYVRSILETQFDVQTIYRSGFSVFTTLDPGLQDEAEKLVKQKIDSLVEYNANNGALVAIRPTTGEILAMVGSADFYNDAISGQVNMATSPTRQPGSSIKPITYLAAFEKGWTPATLIWDVPTDFPPSGDPNDPRPPYVPVNYDGRFHGPVTVRSALANSYNIPAVKALQFSGIYDDPSIPNEDGVVAMAKKLGINSLTRPDYGLSLTLGGGEVSLFELTGAYSVLANGGSRLAPIAISRILDHKGNTVFEYQPTSGEQVIRPEHAFLITSILSDNEARTPMFGADSVLNLPFPAAVKTGTSNDYRDNWTIGYTPDLAVGVWVGNADYTPMENISGVTGAAPIWSEFIQIALQKINGGNPSADNTPSGIVDRVICSLSGTEPSEWCKDQRSEFFAFDQLPLPSSQDLWSKIFLDTWTGLRASSDCSEFTKEEFGINVFDPWAIGWIQNNPEGKTWASQMGFTDPILFAPARDCQQGDSHAIIDLSIPTEGQTVTTSPLDIFGKLDATADFMNFSVQYGLGNDPAEWNELYVGNQPISQSGKIFSWDLNSMAPGIITLKIKINNVRGGYAERLFHINLQYLTPTPTITPTVYHTPTPIPSQTSTPFSTPTAVPTAYPTSSQTAVPSASPTSTQAPTITDNPTPTYTPPPDL